MAAAVGRAMEASERLIVEAGTGVGKSFAYLVPAIMRATTRGEKVVIATATIALQEQLVNKDIPLLVKALGLGHAAPGERVNSAGHVPSAASPLGNPPVALVPVLAKGRGNYVSIRRLQLASQRQGALLQDEQQRRSLHVIEDWAYTTKDGSLSTLPGLERPEVWDHARSDSDNCMGRKCPQFKDCFYQKARRELEKANLIVCNHALFFSDLALRGRGVPGASVLPAYDHVILDEAHNVEDAACEHFGLSLSQPRVMRLLRTLYSQRRRKGYLTERALAIADAMIVDRALGLVLKAEQASRAFFDGLYEYWKRNRASSGRLRRPGMDLGLANPLSPVMSELATCLRRLRDQFESDEDGEQDRFELASFARRASDIADSAEAMLEQTLGAAGDYAYWVEVQGDGAGGGGDQTSVDDGGEWQGGGGRSGRFVRVTLACAPVDVSRLLRTCLFGPAQAKQQPVAPGEPDWDASTPDSAGDASTPIAMEVPSTPKSVVLTSATLATRTIKDGEHQERAETAFAHLISSIGVDSPNTRTLQLGSPFDYVRQAKVIVDLTVPDPKAGGAAGFGARANGNGGAQPAESYAAALADRVAHHALSTRGGAFVLFTSFASMYAVADLVKERFEDHGLTLLVQGRDGSRSMMLSRFLGTDAEGLNDQPDESDDALPPPDAEPRIPTAVADSASTYSPVLFGAASFWQGVDVRGERLRNVIITRLPFEPPDRPLTQARIERIESLGGNPFMQESLPRAVIRFKQGFGRLIRSSTDTGRVVILDPRVRTARYGKLFLDALPRGVPVELVRVGDDD